MSRRPPVPDFLARMAESSRRRARLAAADRPEERLAAAVSRQPAPPPLYLSPQGFDVIAEVKHRSPAAGRLAAGGLRSADQARAYARGGAAALSVLTEPQQFAGRLEHLTDVAATARPVPAMRKDFLVSPYQVLEARAAGAGGVLLIAAMLSDRELAGLVECVLALGMFALVEVFDERDLGRSLAVLATAGPSRAPDGRVRFLIGVNCRNLRTLAVDFGRFAALASALPAGMPRVAESGIDSPAQAARVAELGYDLALVGTALMRTPDPTTLLGSLLEAGRASAPPVATRGA